MSGPIVQSYVEGDGAHTAPAQVALFTGLVWR